MSSRTEDGGFMEQQKYCAFISYRHQSPDREIAGRLHTLIENYVSPASVRGKKGAKHPGKVFRDREELPLSSDLGKDIENALDQSEWLIAVCSPRYMESRWCMRELTYFIERHGRERVLTVLAEGEPRDSFPEILSFTENEAGEKVPVEPLAADVRGASAGESLRKLKKEKLRLLAPMLGVSFDGLYQRQRRRTALRAMAASGAAAAALAGFLIYALIQNGRIDAQRVQAAQNECDLLVEKSISYTAQNRKSDAMRLALEAHGISESLDGYHAEEVREALAVSCLDGDFSVEAQIALPGSGNRVADRAGFSPDGSLISAIISYTVPVCCDARTGEQKWASIPLGNFVTDLCWREDSRALAVISEWSHTVCVLDADTGDRIAEMIGMPDPMTGNRPADAKEIFLPMAARFTVDGKGLYILNDEGLWKWEYTSGADPEMVLALDVGQNARFCCVSDARHIMFASLAPSGVTVLTLPDSPSGAVEACEFHPQDARFIDGFALSPDGKRLYVHQFTGASVCGPDGGEVYWTADAEAYTGTEPPPLWLGDSIFDGNTVRNAATGEVRYTLDDRCVALSPDGAYVLGESRIYRIADGSRYADIPGTLLAADGTGQHLLVSKKDNYRVVKRGDGESSAVPFQTNYYRETAPGGGSQRVLARYEGTLTEIPDWSTPIEAAQQGLYDPYGRNTMGLYMSRQYVDPTGRFLIQTNMGDYVAVYDLEKSNEPVLRLFDFNESSPALGMPGQIVTVPQVADVAFQASGSLAVIAGASGYIAVYDLEEGRMVQSYTDILRERELLGVKCSRTGNMFMTADFNLTTFWVHSITNGLRLYTMHAAGPVSDWGFDEETGDAVIVYTDGSALVARTFLDAEELYAYAAELAER